MKSQEKLPRAMADYGKRFEQGLEQMSPFAVSYTHLRAHET